MAFDVRPVRPNVGLRPVGEGEDSATGKLLSVRRWNWVVRGIVRRLDGVHTI
jgi:hypothetical protein